MKWGHCFFQICPTCHSKWIYGFLRSGSGPDWSGPGPEGKIQMSRAGGELGCRLGHILIFLAHGKKSVIFNLIFWKNKGKIAKSATAKTFGITFWKNPKNLSTLVTKGTVPHRKYKHFFYFFIKRLDKHPTFLKKSCFLVNRYKKYSKKKKKV